SGPTELADPLGPTPPARPDLASAKKRRRKSLRRTIEAPRQLMSDLLAWYLLSLGYRSRDGTGMPTLVEQRFPPFQRHSSICGSGKDYERIGLVRPRIAIFLFGAIALAGCTTRLIPQAEHIRVTRKREDVASCKSLRFVEARPPYSTP